jgi:hypothetical protein
MKLSQNLSPNFLQGCLALSFPVMNSTSVPPLRTPPSSNGLGLVFGNRGLPSSSGYRVLLVAIAYVGRQVAVVVPGVGGNT